MRLIPESTHERFMRHRRRRGLPLAPYERQAKQVVWLWRAAHVLAYLAVGGVVWVAVSRCAALAWMAWRGRP